MHDPALKRLEEAKLYGAGLVAVDTHVLVQRYNEALESLGIEPTRLTRFMIDGVGWSPEIAAEKSNELYLCHGLANPMGIIVSPDQEKKPIYVPFNSYNRRLMRAYFERHAQAVADITTTSAMALEFDTDLAIVENPFDLLLVDYVVVRSYAGRLIEAVKEQKELVRRFKEEPLGWFDGDTRDRIIANGKLYGDLRYRQVEIPDFRFDDLRSFHTRMFGGMYVFRSGEGSEERDFLVVENRELYEKEGGQERENVYGIHEPELVDRLSREDLVEINRAWYKEYPEELDKRREHLVVDTLYCEDPGVDYLSLSRPQRKRCIVALKEKLPAVYTELERFSRRLAQGRVASCHDTSRDLQLLLMRPKDDARNSLKDVLWKLVCKLQTIPDMLQLYKADKNEFFQQYRTWPEGKRAWAVKVILDHYVPEMYQ